MEVGGQCRVKLSVSKELVTALVPLLVIKLWRQRGAAVKKRRLEAPIVCGQPMCIEENEASRRKEGRK